MLRADAPELTAAVDFLRRARGEAVPLAGSLVRLFDPVPMRITRLARRERGQLLIESDRRSALQAFLTRWLERLHALPAPHDLRWQMDVDPLEV
jgi:primosomal protein N' (replication factor Y)